MERVMTIQEAADMLCERTHDLPWTVGVAEPDTIFLYQHDRRAQPPINVAEGWQGFKVEVRYLGNLKPAS